VQEANDRVPTTGSAPLVTSKLRVEARGRWVERRRLHERLERAREVRLVLVSAPPGFGKTTLLADWLASAQLPFAWLTLDAGDNDIVRFARYLAAAVTRLADGTGDGPEFEPVRPLDPESALTAILAPIEMDAASRGEGLLVLDDYHVIAEPAIHRLVASLLERLPTHMRLAIATRADPPLPLARLRARGEMIELRATDLRFSGHETAELLRSMAVDIDDAAAEDLARRTEGWAAALRLASISLQGRSDGAELVRRFGATNRYVLDYVVDEVLAGLPPETHDFLLRTSVLERLCGPLCDAVTGGSDGQARLESLERANLLIVPLDEERRWYRYHALFAEILRSRLTATHGGGIAELHARASAWHEEQANDDEAVAHALASGDPERIRRVLVSACRRRLRAGEMSTVRRWLDALPPEVGGHDPELIVVGAWCRLYVAETDGVARLAADAETALANGRDVEPVRRAAISAELALLRSYLASISGGSATSAIEQARRAIALLPEGLPAASEANLRGSAQALLALGLLRAGELDAAVEAYEASLADLRASGNAFALGRSITDIARIAIDRGDPESAVRVCERELRRTDGGCSVTQSGAVWAALARARAELGQIEPAEEAARHALDLATRAGDAASVRYAQATLDRLAPLPAHADAAGTTAHRNAARILEALSKRELEVLRLVARGRSNTEIAAELFVTVGTVKAHVHSICGKLGAANRVQAIVRGRDLGLLD
jgi:LuxR family maltose regulon positive regulatory protein